jgi:hypothetical protein
MGSQKNIWRICSLYTGRFVARHFSIVRCLCSLSSSSPSLHEQVLPVKFMSSGNVDTLHWMTSNITLRSIAIWVIQYICIGPLNRSLASLSSSCFARYLTGTLTPCSYQSSPEFCTSDFISPIFSKSTRRWKGTQPS